MGMVLSYHRIMPSLSDKARALIAKSTFEPKTIDDGCYYDVAEGATRPCKKIDKDVLVASFAHIIDIGSKTAPKKGAPLGASLRFGHPHLPKSFKAPKGLNFWLQINLEELDPHDIDDIFPDRGMVWVSALCSTRTRAMDTTTRRRARSFRRRSRSCSSHSSGASS
jgi:hypothetical protein